MEDFYFNTFIKPTLERELKRIHKEGVLKGLQIGALISITCVLITLLLSRFL